MIMFYIIFATSRNGVGVAMLRLGVNSGAYVAELIRGGIMAIDKGQLEAGRSLGFDYVQTMRFINSRRRSRTCCRRWQTSLSCC